jgi:hypothetical protein
MAIKKDKLRIVNFFYFNFNFNLMFKLQICRTEINFLTRK